MDRHLITTPWKFLGVDVFHISKDRIKINFNRRHFLVCSGYSLLHKGYRYYHPQTRKIFISRHVIFDELYLPHVSTSVDFSTEPNVSHFTTFREFLWQNALQTQDEDSSRECSDADYEPAHIELVEILPSLEQPIGFSTPSGIPASQTQSQDLSASIVPLHFSNSPQSSTSSSINNLFI